MPLLLLVTHANGASTRAVVAALRAGADDGAAAVDGVVVEHREALALVAGDVRAADAVIFATAEHFGTMSGGLKHAFDTTYNLLREHTDGLPYALVVKAGNDGTGTVRDVGRICIGLRWRAVREPLVLVGELTDDGLAAVHELGATLAAALSLGAV